MRRIILASVGIGALALTVAAWAAELIWFSLSTLVGGLDNIAANCPSKGAACGLGAIEFVFGAIGAVVGAYGVYFGNWKRDQDGSMVYHIYQKPKWSPRSIGQGKDLSQALRQHNASDPARLVYHHLDGRTIDGLYFFDQETRMHHAFGEMGLHTKLAKREVVDGNDGYAAAIHDDDIGTFKKVAHAKADSNEWATLAYDQMKPSNADSICMGMKDPDNNESVAVVRIQPATQGDYQNLNLDACNGHGFRKRRPQTDSDVSCQEVCGVISGPKEACAKEGGGCSYQHGGCRATLTQGQPSTACDGIVCAMRRSCIP